MGFFGKCDEIMILLFVTGFATFRPHKKIFRCQQTVRGCQTNDDRTQYEKQLVHPTSQGYLTYKSGSQ
jgi:hypothetical protein